MEQIQEEKISEQDIIKTLFKERDTYQQTSLTQRNEINEIYDSYMGKLSDTKDRSKSQEKIMKLRTETAYIVSSIFSGQPKIEVEGVGEEDKVISQVIEKIINYRLETIPQCYEKIEAWVKQATVFGTSIMKVIWKFETKKEIDPQTQQEYETPVKDEPDLEVPNILDCFYNPIIPDVECQSSIIFRSVIPVDEVKENPIYDFVNDIGEVNREKVASKGGSGYSQYDSTKQVRGDKIDLQKAGEGTIDIYERVINDRIQTIADGKEKLVLRDKPKDSGMIEAVKLIHEPNAIPNRFDGLGVGHNTLGIGKLYQKLSNRLLDAVNLSNNPFFLFKKGSVSNNKQLVVRVGGGVEVDGEKPLNEYIQAVQFPDIKQGAINLLNKFDDDHKRASGANDLLQGSASNKTLGQDQIASTYSSNRFELINRRFKQGLADVANIIIKLELKNLQSPDSPILRIFPQELRVQIYQLLISEARDAKYNIKVKGETNVAKNKEIMLREFREWLEMFKDSLPPENQMECAKKWLEMRGITDIDKLVPDPQMFAQQQMQQQAMQQMATGGQPQVMQ